MMKKMKHEDLGKGSFVKRMELPQELVVVEEKSQDLTRGVPILEYTTIVPRCDIAKRPGPQDSKEVLISSRIPL